MIPFVKKFGSKKKKKLEEYKEKKLLGHFCKGDHKTFWKLLKKIHRKIKTHLEIIYHQKDGKNI